MEKFEDWFEKYFIVIFFVTIISACIFVSILTAYYEIDHPCQEWEERESLVCVKPMYRSGCLEYEKQIKKVCVKR